MTKKNKLIPRKFSQVFKGKNGLNVSKVYETLYNKSYDDLDEKLKKKFNKAYKKNLEDLDELYLLKLIDKNTAAYANPASNETEQNLELEITDKINKQSLQRSYEYLQSHRPDLFNATKAWNDNISKLDENQLIEEVLRAAPLVRLNQLLIDNAVGGHRAFGSVKHTANDKYYESLIKKANQKYGTNFKTREDVAAFLKTMGAKKIDGIIGPETEYLLAFYYPRKSKVSINPRKMYTNKSNLEVRDETFSILSGIKDVSKTLPRMGSKSYHGALRDANNVSAPLAIYVPPEAFSYINPEDKFSWVPDEYNYSGYVPFDIINPYSMYLRNLIYNYHNNDSSPYEVVWE